MGSGDESILSCHGDTGCIFRQARASLVWSCTGVLHLPSWLLSPGSAGLVPSFWGGTWGTEQGDCVT